MYLVHQVTSSAVELSPGSQPCVSSAAMCSWPPGPLFLASPSGAVFPALELNIHLPASSTNWLIPNLCLNQTEVQTQSSPRTQLLNKQNKKEMQTRMAGKFDT